MIKRLFQPVDIASLVVFRIAFGLIMLWEVWRYDTNGWIEQYFIAPKFYFTYLAFDWVKPWGGDGMYWHFYGLYVLAVFIAIGFAYRLSTVLFFLTFSYIFLLDQARYLNHFYLICLLSFLLILVPAHRAFSVDAWLFKSIRSNVVPTWALWILRFQIGVVYIYAGIAKLNHDWLRGDPMRDWLADRTDFPVIGQWFTEEWMVYGFSYGGLLLDLLVVPFLLWQRTRWLALGVAIIFHFTNHQLFNIGVFPFMMIAATTLFLNPDYPRRVKLPEPDFAIPPLHSLRTTAFLSLVGVYVLFQLVFPLRHWLYPGNVHWTEEGHRFSWHMKLRDKEGEAHFMLVDTATGTRWEVPLEDYLMPHQISDASTRPDMIVQLARYLGEVLQEPETGPIEIRVITNVSLNGRPPQPLVNPEIDLSAEKRSWRASDWIVPLQEPADTAAR